MTAEHLRLLAELLEMESDFLEECVRNGAIVLEDLPESGPRLTPSQVARLRRLQRLCLDLEIDPYAAGIIVDLMDRVDELERELGRR